jgi:hypothetical protein
MKIWIMVALTLAAGAAQAHPGHGLDGGHWHATDAWGWVALAAGIALVLWLRRGR